MAYHYKKDEEYREEVDSEVALACKDWKKLMKSHKKK